MATQEHTTKAFDVDMQEITRLLAEMGGLVLGFAGLALLLALASYDPRDPSVNTATARHAANLAGPSGAVLADG